MQRAMEAIRSVPGVEAAGATTILPLTGVTNTNVIFPEGFVSRADESFQASIYHTVTPGYFEAMKIPLRGGRYFTNRDTETSGGVIILDERLAQRFWPEGNPVGRRVYRPTSTDLSKPEENAIWYTVIGIVSEIHIEDLGGNRNTSGAYYLAYSQDPESAVTFAIKTAADPGAIITRVRSELNKLDRDLPLFDVLTMTQRAEASLLSRRIAMSLALTFASVALFLAAIGIYGVLAYLVAQRKREIGIRMALGGTASDIFRLILTEGLLLLAAGLITGIFVAQRLTSVIANQLYAVQPTDPVVIGAVIGIVGVVAVAACIIPARRATQVDPMIVLTEQ
jgi:putative ABC transport system permease protein